MGESRHFWDFIFPMRKVLRFIAARFFRATQMGEILYWIKNKNGKLKKKTMSIHHMSILKALRLLLNIEHHFLKHHYLHVRTIIEQ